MLSICHEIMYVMPVGFKFFLKIYKSHKARTYRVNIKSNDFPIKVRLQPDQPRSAMVTHLVCREIFQGTASLVIGHLLYSQWRDLIQSAC